VKIWSDLSKIRETGVQVLIGVNSNILIIFLSGDLIRKEEANLIEDKNQEHQNNNKKDCLTGQGRQ
jgi:hypothetical protein